MDNIAFELRFCKTDSDLIKKIAKKRKLEQLFVKRVMRYNCWTVKQFADLTGRNISTVTNMTLHAKKAGNEFIPTLDICYPFSDFNGDGPKFIIRNEKSLEILDKSL